MCIFACTSKSLVALNGSPHYTLKAKVTLIVDVVQDDALKVVHLPLAIYISLLRKLVNLNLAQIETKIWTTCRMNLTSAHWQWLPVRSDSECRRGPFRRCARRSPPSRRYPAHHAAPPSSKCRSYLCCAGANPCIALHSQCTTPALPPGPSCCLTSSCCILPLVIAAAK